MSLNVLHSAVVMMAIALIGIVALILALSALASTAGLKRKIKRLKGNAGVPNSNSSEMVLYLEHKIDGMQIEMNKLKSDLEHQSVELRKKISTAKIQRFNAFNDLGSDLSFSIAFVDDDKNGLVLSSIYGRDESRTYAKPVTSGTSQYALTQEEIAVLSVQDTKK